MQAAKTLKADKIPATRACYTEQEGKALSDNPYSWNDNSVAGILECMDYCGHHEAIVEEAVFERMQELQINKCRPTKAERQGMFSGLVFCAYCRSKLLFATCKNFDGSQDQYRLYRTDTETAV